MNSIEILDYIFSNLMNKAALLPKDSIILDRSLEKIHRGPGSFMSHFGWAVVFSRLHTR